MAHRIGKGIGILLVSFFLTINCLALTAIPDTPEARKTRARELEIALRNRDNPTQLRELAMIYSAIAGIDNSDEQSVRRAEKLLRRASKLFPNDYELMAAHGSVITMMAATQTSTAGKLRTVKRGIRKMDRAIKRDPDNIGALLQRASNSLALPGFLKRTHFAKKDFSRILRLTEDRLGPRFKAMILFHLGRARYKMNEKSEAAGHWREVKQMNVVPWSKKAAERLDSL